MTKFAEIMPNTAAALEDRLEDKLKFLSPMQKIAAPMVKDAILNFLGAKLSEQKDEPFDVSEIAHDFRMGAKMLESFLQTCTTRGDVIAKLDYVVAHHEELQTLFEQLFPAETPDALLADHANG